MDSIQETDPKRNKNHPNSSKIDGIYLRNLSQKDPKRMQNDRKSIDSIRETDPKRIQKGSNLSNRA